METQGVNHTIPIADGFEPHYVNNYIKECEWTNTGTQDIMVFHPTMEEFRDFPELIRKIEKAGAHLASGICKIVPPKEWSPRPSKRPGDYSDMENFFIHQPVKESIEGTSGCFTRSIKVYRKRMTVGEFKKLAVSKELSNPKPEANLIELERHYWRSLLYGESIYGADTPGTLYDADVNEFNMQKLGTILDLLDERIAGVNTTFLYFGMWKATFPWHVEDMDLYSINYLHYGEPKFWYAIPSQAAEKFERLACQQFPDGSMICKAFLRHKLYIISPTILKNHSIPYGTMVQYPNEFIITFPKGYHMGFNVGYNCAESTNFALERWIDFGKNAVLCQCRDDGVEIDMRPFMRIYRPDEFEVWNDYWYGERHASVKDGTSKKKKATIDPILESIYTERQKRLAHAKRSVKNIWASSPINLFHEKDYNLKRAKLFPHCAVCQYFIPRRILISQKASRSQSASLPRTSLRFVTDQLFYKDKALSKERQTIEEDELLECSNCHVVVHKRCYSVFENVPVKRFIEAPGESPQAFLCIRCYNRDDVAIRSASCALCELRGGALIETISENGVQQFVHVICALIHPKTLFLDPDKRRELYRPPPKWLLPESPKLLASKSISVRNSDENNRTASTNSETEFNMLTVGGVVESVLPDSLEKFDDSAAVSTMNTTLSSTIQPIQSQEPASRYQCEVCNGLSHNLIQCDICLQTEENSAAASLRYHITCAPLADMSFERRDISPYSIAVCSFHNSCHVLAKPDTRRINVGDRVIVCLKSKDLSDNEDLSTNQENDAIVVRKGHVQRISESLYCTVDFMDGSVSTDLFTCDIRSCECHQFGCANNHLPGSLVYVYWHDEEIYEAYYRGKVPIRKYTVQLDSCVWENFPKARSSNDTEKDHEEVVVELEQDCVFAPDEPLPEEIRNALLKRKPIDV